jgi:hypothetical protein
MVACLATGASASWAGAENACDDAARLFALGMVVDFATGVLVLTDETVERRCRFANHKLRRQGGLDS